MSEAPPTLEEDEARLLERARGLLGLSIGELAERVGFPLPSAPTRHKGAIGHLVERALGVEAGSRPGPDFASGIELKTLPIDARGHPAESTFVTVVGPSELELPWERSHARAKLAHVLFVPVEARGVRPFEARRFGCAFFFRPTTEEEDTLARDYEALREELLLHGEVSASRGEALQVRPKGQSASDEAVRIDADGAPRWQLKRAFYLRARFTRAILERSGFS